MLYREAGQYKVSYAQDQQIFPIRQDRIAVLAILAVAFFIVPVVGSQYMVLHAEVAGDGRPDIEAIIATIRDVTKLRGEVAIRKSGELPNDGKIIDDTRKFT